MTVTIAGLALLLVTGHALARLLRLRLWRDPISSTAIKLGLGLSAWPLLLLWTSTAGLRLGVVSTRLIFALLCAGVCADALFRKRRSTISPASPGRWAAAWLFLGIAVAAAWTRVQQIRDLALPAWVDSIHHMMIVRLIVDHGTLPSSYEPYIPASEFYYHWGYHAIMSSVIWLTGRTDPFEIARAMVDFGQLLNALTVLPMYAAGRALFRSHRAGLWAAALAALVSYFPAYYVSWGRYTHLCGTLILPLIPLAAARMRNHDLGSIVSAAILAAGLALVHVRLALFAATALAVLAVYRLLRRTMLRRLPSWSGFALLTLALTAPWLVRLTTNQYVHRILSPSAAMASDWDTPTGVRSDLAWAPRNRELLILGTGGIAGLALWSHLNGGWRAVSIGLWLATMALTELAHRRRRSLRTLWRGIGGLAAWGLATAIFLNLDVFGLPRLRVASNTSAVITSFIPLCLSLAGFISAATAVLLIRSRRIELATSMAIVVTAVFGVLTIQPVMNPQTILAREADVNAMRWVKAHTPPESVFMVRTRRWLGRSRMGIDGGAWIQLLTDRRSTLLPGLYPWVTSGTVVEETESLLGAFENAASEDDETLRELLVRAGVTHVYFGDSDEGVSWTALSERPYSKLVYQDGRVHIFELTGRGKGEISGESAPKRQAAWSAEIEAPTRRAGVLSCLICGDVSSR